jgi:hypothetical protein
MAKLIGNAPNQVPTNADLGSMAFEDKKNYATTSSPIYQPYRNIIINGDMSIAQRGTSTASITSNAYYTVDRFQTIISSLGTWTQSQSTDVPTGQGFATSLKMDCTTADATPSANDLLILRTKFEGQNLQYLKKGTANALPLTLSFWVKSTKTGTFIAELNDIDNTRQISKSYTVDVTNTWEKKTITYAGDTSGAFGNDNGDSLNLNLWLSAGTDYTSGTLNTSWGSRVNANRVVGQVNIADSTSNDFYITGVQLEAGTTASDFEFLPVDVNLQRCQRYFEVFKKEGSETVICLAQGISSAQVFGRLFFKTEKRAVPSGSVSAFGDFQVLLGNASSWSTATTGGLGSGDLKCIRLNLEGLSGMTIGGCHELRINGANGKVFCDAEL